MKYLMTLIFLLLANISLPQNRDSTVYTQLPPFYIDLGTLTINEGTINICEDDTVFISHVFLQDTIIFYSDTSFVADTICEPVIIDVGMDTIRPPPLGIDFNIPGDFPTPFDIDWNLVKNKTIKVTGTYQGNWSINGAENTVVLFENFILENGGDRGINLDNSNNLTLKAVDSDPNNFRIRNFGGKHLRMERCNNIVIDGAWIETGNSGGQTDCIYVQRTRGLTVRNCKLIINNEDTGGHNDIIQMFLVGGNVLIENNVGLQNNSKTTNNQGIYATTPWSGSYQYLNNFLSGTQKNGQLTFHKNCLTLQRNAAGGGVDVPIEIRFNRVVSNGTKHIWLKDITNYNDDIRTSNDVDPNKITIQ